MKEGDRKGEVMKAKRKREKDRKIWCDPRLIF
jgi:hypothetical protein